MFGPTLHKRLLKERRGGASKTTWYLQGGGHGMGGSLLFPFSFLSIFLWFMFYCLFLVLFVLFFSYCASLVDFFLLCTINTYQITYV